MIGLPLHLWGKRLLKSLGQACRDLMVVDEEVERLHFQKARILVKSNQRKE